jgi:hypothetical protein
MHHDVTADRGQMPVAEVLQLRELEVLEFRELLGRWLRLESRVLAPHELAELCQETRRALGRPPDRDG